MTTGLPPLWGKHPDLPWGRDGVWAGVRPTGRIGEASFWHCAKRTVGAMRALARARTLAGSVCTHRDQRAFSLGRRAQKETGRPLSFAEHG